MFFSGPAHPLLLHGASMTAVTAQLYPDAVLLAVMVAAVVLHLQDEAAVVTTHQERMNAVIETEIMNAVIVVIVVIALAALKTGKIPHRNPLLVLVG